IIGLVEVQDNSGNMVLGDASCDETLDELIVAIEKIPSNTAKYRYKYINPIYETEGGEPGGNIRVVFMYNENRVAFADKPTDKEKNNDKEFARKLSEKAVELIDINGKLGLSLNPGRIEPLNPDFSATRKSLVGEFVFKGERVFIILNHLIAKGGDEALGARFHPPIFKSEEKRLKQAKIINKFVEEMLNIEPEANIIVIGDFNDFHFSETLKTLRGNLLTNLIETLPKNDRYSYLYQGNSQILDNVLISKKLLTQKPEIDIVHCNAEYSYNLNYTDHDPVLSAFTFGDDASDKSEPDFYPEYPIADQSKCFSISLKIKLSETGRVYYAGFPENFYTPTNYEIKSGRFGDTNPIGIRGVFNVEKESERIFLIENLNPNVNYNFYFLTDDNSLNLSSIPKTIVCKTKDLEERPMASGIFISEYIEGSAYNKALEIFNFTGSEIDLSNYSLRRDGNSDGDFDDLSGDKYDKELKLKGFLAHNKTFVIRYKREDLDPYLKSIANMSDDTATGVIAFGGEDPL
ncbi:MAG TPA: hypothetical protein PLO89_09425, partial [Spirochaetota bacterium]|nr:hypothetical protein [Spirochaetota bacterium]